MFATRLTAGEGDRTPQSMAADRPGVEQVPVIALFGNCRPTVRHRIDDNDEW
jgi:hypothetical protein